MATGNFALSFTGNPVAHSQHLWNILGMYIVGFAATLAGGCPLRQLVLAGQGSSDAAVTVAGLFVGAALCHKIGISSGGTCNKRGGSSYRRTVYRGESGGSYLYRAVICHCICRKQEKNTVEIRMKI